MGEVGSHPAYLWGREQFERLVRGDAMAGLVEDTVAMERDMMDALWEAAAEGSGEAYRLIGDCYFALVRPIGAFEGVAPLDAVGRPWSEEASAIADDNPAVEATLRAYGEAVRLGERGALKPFAFLARFSTETVQRRVLAAIDALADPIAGELYLRGLLLHWLGDAEASFEAHRRAAEAGDPDAKFELSLCYGQGLGVPPDPEQARLWLGRAAAANHPRALYNLGAAHASAAPPDFARAADCYERAAEAGHGQAAATLAVMILTGELTGTVEEARARLDQADALGFSPEPLLTALGVPDPRG